MNTNQELYCCKNLTGKTFHFQEKDYLVSAYLLAGLHFLALKNPTCLNLCNSLMSQIYNQLDPKQEIEVDNFLRWATKK